MASLGIGNGDGELDHEESGVFQDDSDANFTLDSEGNTSLSFNQFNDEPTAEDPELEAIKARVREMEEEAEKLKEMQNQVEKQMMSSPTSLNTSFTSSEDTDSKSVYVGNVDYGSTAEELEQHFHGCGSVNRVTILCDKYSGHPKGFAYIEFADKDSVTTAMALDESLFRGRQIKVNPKRTNVPGVSTTNRGRRAAFGARRSYRSPVVHSYRGSYRPRRFRPRRSNWYSPY